MCPAELVYLKGKSHAQIYNNTRSALEGLISDSAVLTTHRPLTNSTITTRNKPPPITQPGENPYTDKPCLPPSMTWRRYHVYRSGLAETEELQKSHTPENYRTYCQAEKEKSTHP